MAWGGLGVQVPSGPLFAQGFYPGASKWQATFTLTVIPLTSIREECPQHSPKHLGQSGTSYPNMYYCYLLKLSNGKYYTGFTDNLKNRLQDHQRGKVLATKQFLPFSLAYYSAFTTKTKALEFEQYLKTYSGFAFRNKRLI